MDVERRYHPPRKYFWTAIFFVAFFGIVDVGTVAIAFFNVDGSFARPYLGAVIFGAFWSAWVLLSLGMLTIALRYELIVSHDGLEQTGAFRSQRLHFDELHSARWRGRPQAGRIVLRSSVERMVVDFSRFSNQDRKEVIDHLRERIRAGKQLGWDKFSFVQDAVTRAKNTRQARILATVAFLFFIAFFSFLAYSQSRNELYIAAALNVVFAAYAIYGLRPTAAKSRTS